MGLGRTVVSDEEDEIGEEEEPRDAEDTADRDDDEEDDEDEDGVDEYEKDDFIVDDVDEEEDQDEELEDKANSDEERHKKKRKKKRESEKNYVLDEDDYELLQDNNVGFHRPKPGSKKFKRLKKAGRDNDVGERFGFSDDEDKSGGRKLKHSLFGDEAGPHLEDIAEEDEQPEEEEDVDMGDDDEMADFIVEGDLDERGAPVRQKKRPKKIRPAAGVSSSALQEAHDIFGDVDELLIMRKEGLEKSRFNDYGDLREKRLEDEFEPFVLSEKYMTEKDYHIKELDVPERMQISEESTGPAPTDELSIEDESVWIHNQLITNYKSLFVNTEEIPTYLSSNIKDDIPRFLELMHVDKYDIPFIAMYRKENCPTLLKDLGQEEVAAEDTRKLKWHKILWTVKDLDKKWLLLQKRKSSLHSYYNKRFEEESRRIYDETRLNLNQQLFESIIESLKTAETEREVDDVDSKFNLHFPPGEVGVEEGQFKRPKRKSQYSVCSKAGLWEVASKIGYSSEKLGLLINLEANQDPLDDAQKKETPEDIASNFTCAMFETPQAVLKGARHMAAVEISCEPRVRKHVRGKFMSEAVVSTNPTPEGNLAIDSFHQYAGVKWLREKPVKEFKDAQWFLIQKAEEEKLLQVTIKLPQDKLDHLKTEFTDYYLSDGVSAAAKIWNEQRNLILQDALTNFLLPSMEKEVRSVLTARSKNYLLMEYGQHLWTKVSVKPYKRKDNDVGSDDEAAVKVMGCCWGRGSPGTTFVMLDSFGEVVDTLEANYISSRSQNVNDQQRKKNDQQRLLKFVKDHQPHAVVLGAVNLICPKLKDDIYEIIFKIVEESPRDIGDEMADTPVFFGDESLPRIYENSRISTDQIPGHPGIAKRAAALGRYLQNPLAMVATLCGPGREILSWKLHPSEDFLTPDEKYEMVEQVMVDVTNQVGIDINLAASHEWLFSPLQFVSGLGPRKAASLQKALVRNSVITTRKELLGEFVKRKVFMNAVGFLRIRRSGIATSSSHIIDLLDDTRIHPESYELAKHMAKDVFNADNDDDSNEDDDVREMAIEHVRERPVYLKRLDINEYAKSAEANYNAINKKETLYDIKIELLHGFRDWRIAYKQPEQDEEFYMLTGETADTLAEGRIVQVTVRRVQSHRAFCDLESRVTGVLNADDYSDMMRPEDLTLELNEGAVLTCKIKNVEIARHQVYLTCKESELKSDRYQNSENMDPFYKPDEASIQSEHEKARKEKELAKKKHFKPRMIVHPRFQNITPDEAKVFLSDKEAGESIIHPSYRGPSCLTLTLKVYDGIYAHKDIAESGKDHKDITSLLRLGKTLKIGDDTFEDLDEVIDRYVDPLVTQLKAMLNYRKFRKGTKAEVDDVLKKEKSENPMRIVYCFGISYEHPGTFILSYIRSSNPHHELISLYPKGFKFRKRTFEDIDRLVAYFQRHIDDMPPDSTQSIRSVAAMVPMRSPAGVGSSGSAWGGSAANGNDGSWGGHGNSDRERSSTPGLRQGRNDYTSGGRDGHPSGLPRHDGGRGRGRGRDRGRGRGSFNGRGNNRGNETEDSGFGSSSWTAGPKDDNDGWGSFPGAKVQNSPGREAFPGGSGSGGWGGSGNSSGGGDGWGSAAGGGGDGWGSGSGDGWGSGGGGGGGTSEGWGGGSSDGRGSGRGRGGRGRDRGRGRGSFHSSRGNNRNNETEDSTFGSSSWSSGPKDDNDGLSSFPGAKVQNSPGREAFPGGSGGWGGGNTTTGGGWASGGGGGGNGWGSSGGGGDGWGSGTGKGGGDWNSSGTKGSGESDPGAENGKSAWNNDSNKKSGSAPSENGGTGGWGSTW